MAQLLITWTAVAGWVVNGRAGESGVRRGSARLGRPRTAAAPWNCPPPPPPDSPLPLSFSSLPLSLFFSAKPTCFIGISFGSTARISAVGASKRGLTWRGGKETEEGSRLVTGVLHALPAAQKGGWCKWRGASPAAAAAVAAADGRPHDRHQHCSGCSSSSSSKQVRDASPARTTGRRQTAGAAGPEGRSSCRAGGSRAAGCLGGSSSGPAGAQPAQLLPLRPHHSQLPAAHANPTPPRPTTHRMRMQPPRAHMALNGPAQQPPHHTGTDRRDTHTHAPDEDEAAHERGRDVVCVVPAHRRLAGQPRVDQPVLAHLAAGGGGGGRQSSMCRSG